MFKYVKKCKFLLVAKLFLFLLSSCSVDGDIDVLDLEQLQIFDFPSRVMKVVYDGVEKQGEDTIDFGVCNEELVKEVKVFNVWRDTLLLQDVAIESDGSFMLKHSVRGVLIAPGESYSIEIAYIPLLSSSGALMLRANTTGRTRVYLLTRVFRLKGCSDTRNACFKMTMLHSLQTKAVSAMIITVEEPITADIRLVAECSQKIIWSTVEQLAVGENKINITEEYPDGQYIIQIYTTEGLCEYPFKKGKNK